MEELTDKISEAFSSSLSSSTTEQSRLSLWKKSGCGGSNSQETRRRRILDNQKKNRFDSLSHARNLAEGCWDTKYKVPKTEQECKDQPSASGGKELTTTEQNSGQDENNKMEVDCFIPGRQYKDQLMLSEWFLEVPENFEKEWIMVLCPVGRRCLVVASKGLTSVYSKSGYRINKFSSILPGGCRRTGGKNYAEGYTILDCVYDEVHRTFHVLDVLCWNSHPVMDCDTEFRMMWKKTKLDELSANPAETRSSSNPFIFVSALSVECQKPLIEEALSDNTVRELDGLLFYHQEAHYLFGPSPAVLWLKPYMTAEALSLSATSANLYPPPPTYTGFQGHLKTVLDIEEPDSPLKDSSNKETHRHTDLYEKRPRRAINKPRAAKGTVTKMDAQESEDCLVTEEDRDNVIV